MGFGALGLSSGFRVLGFRVALGACLHPTGPYQLSLFAQTFTCPAGFSKPVQRSYTRKLEGRRRCSRSGRPSGSWSYTVLATLRNPAFMRHVGSDLIPDGPRNTYLLRLKQHATKTPPDRRYHQCCPRITITPVSIMVAIAIKHRVGSRQRGTLGRSHLGLRENIDHEHDLQTFNP